MSSFKHPVFQGRILATDVASVLQGTHHDYQQEWLKTRWIQHAGGFKLSKGTSLPPGMKPATSNPRHTGDWILINGNANENDVVACDYIACNGKMQCSKPHNNACSVILRISYYGDGSCSLFTESPNVSHGLNYLPDRNKLPMSRKTKGHVEKYAFMIRPNMAPSNVRRILLSEFPNHHGDRSIVPTIPQISDHIGKLRAKKRENVWNYCLKLSNEYPGQLINIPSNVSPRFVVLRSTSRLFDEFSERIGNPDSVVGMDAQYKNNKERMPFWVICSQTKDFTTVPGFVIVGETSKASVLTPALQVVKEFLEANGTPWKATVMIDKDKTERKALLSNDLRFILCEFHVAKAIKPLIKSIGSLNGKADFIQGVKRIARSQTKKEQSDAIVRLKKICGPSSDLWEKFEANWLCEAWLHAWVDLDRPGDRQGLWNTNNASESFFKSLLRNYLNGRSYCASEVMEIILKDVFRGYQDLLTTPSRRGKNPTVKRAERLQKKAETLCEKSEIVVRKNPRYEILLIEGKKRNGFKLSKHDDVCECPTYQWHGRLCVHLKIRALLRTSEARLQPKEPPLPPGPVPKTPSRLGKRRRPGPVKTYPFKHVKDLLHERYLEEEEEQSKEDQEEEGNEVGEEVYQDKHSRISEASSEGSLEIDLSLSLSHSDSLIIDLESSSDSLIIHLESSPSEEHTPQSVSWIQDSSNDGDVPAAPAVPRENERNRALLRASVNLLATEISPYSDQITHSSHPPMDSPHQVEHVDTKIVDPARCSKAALSFLLN